MAAAARSKQEGRAATRVQASYRGQLGRASAKRASYERLRRESSAQLVQSHARRRSAIARRQRCTAAAVVLQRAERDRQSRAAAAAGSSRCSKCSKCGSSKCCWGKKGAEARGLPLGEQGAAPTAGAGRLSSKWKVWQHTSRRFHFHCTST